MIDVLDGNRFAIFFFVQTFLNPIKCKREREKKIYRTKFSSIINNFL